MCLFGILPKAQSLRPNRIQDVDHIWAREIGPGHFSCKGIGQKQMENQESNMRIGDNHGCPGLLCLLDAPLLKPPCFYMCLSQLRLTCLKWRTLSLLFFSSSRTLKGLCNSLNLQCPMCWTLGSHLVALKIMETSGGWVSRERWSQVWL